MKAELKWYVVQVQTGKERGIADTLQAASIMSIAPAEIIHERRRGRWWPRRKPIMPGYVFVHVGLIPRIYYYINNLPGVIRLLGSPNPESVPEEQLAAILCLCNEGRDFDISQGEKIDGETIITSGPLMGLQDKIVKVNARARRATVAVPILDKICTLDVGVIITRSATRNRNIQDSGTTSRADASP